MTLEICLEMVAPYYNLALVTIVVILFIILFKKKNEDVYIRPWQILFIAILIYIFEQILNVLFNLGLIVFPRILNAILEMLIITSFIYVLLLKLEYVKKLKK